MTGNLSSNGACWRHLVWYRTCQQGSRDCREGSSGTGDGGAAALAGRYYCASDSSIKSEQLVFLMATANVTSSAYFS